MLKRLRIAGLCLVAIFALGAVGASSAMAEHLVAGKCNNVGAGAGSWKDGNCTEAEAGGEWEWETLKTKVPFTSVSGIKKLFAGGKVVECKKDKNIGELTGATTDTVKIIFEECEEPVTKVSCENEGFGTKKIGTKTLLSKLSWLKRAAPMTVGLDLEPLEKGGLFTEFTCLIENVKVGGSVIGSITPLNTMSTKAFLEFKCISGKQQYTKDEGEPTDTLTASLKGEPAVEACEEEVTPDTITFNQAVEIWAAFP